MNVFEGGSVENTVRDKRSRNQIKLRPWFLLGVRRATGPFVGFATDVEFVGENCHSKIVFSDGNAVDRNGTRSQTMGSDKIRMARSGNCDRAQCIQIMVQQKYVRICRVRGINLFLVLYSVNQ